MKNKKAILSICIPTYNRSNSLSRTLKKLINQKWFNRDIEIIISDNASQDDTKTVVEKYKKIYNNIHYYRNSHNIWYDRNLDKALTLANGMYIWTLSDDENIIAWTLDYIVKTIHKYKNISYIGLTKIDKNKNEVLLQNGNEMIRKYGILSLWLISRNIFHKKYIPKKREKYYGNLWIHVSIMLECIKDSPLILSNKEFFKQTKNTSCSWAKWGTVFTTFINLKKIIKHTTDIWYDKNTIKKYIKHMVQDFPKTLISAKIQWLKYQHGNFKILIKELYSFPFILSISMIILLIPNKIFIILNKYTRKWL